MKILAIDIGNTDSVFGVFDGDLNLISQYRMRTDAARTGDEYYAWLKILLDRDGIAFAFDRAILSSTVPKAVFNIRKFCTRHLDQNPLVIGSPDLKFGKPPQVDAGVRVGSDRLVNVFEVSYSYQTPAIIVDFGTATNFDCANAQGAYIGGAIAPGVNLSLKALTDAAAALPTIDVARPARVIGTNTISTMQTGIYWGYIGLVEGIATRIQTEFGETPMKVIATGGLASLYVRGTSIFDAVDLDLTIRGLARIARDNIPHA